MAGMSSKGTVGPWSLPSVLFLGNEESGICATTYSLHNVPPCAY